MLNTRIKLTRAMTAELVELEKQVDGALITQAKLQTIAIEGRRDARLPLHAGQEGFELLTSAAAQLIAARKAIHEAHMVFRSVRTEMGLPVTSFGDYGDTPDGFAPMGSAELTVVQAA